MTATPVVVSDIVSKTGQTRALTTQKISQIRAITGRLRILALNAMIEATHAGDLGKGFAIVAQEVRSISTEVEGLSGAFAQELLGEIAELEALAQRMAHQAQGSRCVDLALNAIELIDRNLYERTCDVRWWATDAAIVDCAAQGGEAGSTLASQRLGVILSAYTVYLDIWLCDLDGRVIASGRADRYAVRGQSMAQRPWFATGKGLPDGNAYGVTEVAVEPALGNAQVATYVASVREGGAVDGRPIGLLAIHFDWEPQARAIVDGVRLAPDEQQRTRVLLIDAKRRVIAASDGRGVLSEHIELDTKGGASGFHTNNRAELIAFHRTPGYETYAGLGWHGVIVQKNRA